MQTESLQNISDLIQGSFIHAQNQLFYVEDWLLQHARGLAGAVSIHGSLDWSLTGTVYPKIHVRFPSYDEALAFVIQTNSDFEAEAEKEKEWIRVQPKDLNENVTLCVWWN